MARSMLPIPMGNESQFANRALDTCSARFEREHLPIPPVVREPDYFERAYRQGADDQEL